MCKDLRPEVYNCWLEILVVCHTKGFCDRAVGPVDEGGYKFLLPYREVDDEVIKRKVFILP